MSDKRDRNLMDVDESTAAGALFGFLAIGEAVEGPDPLDSYELTALGWQTAPEDVPQIPAAAHAAFTQSDADPPEELQAECDAAIRQAAQALKSRHLAAMHNFRDRRGYRSEADLQEEPL